MQLQSATKDPLCNTRQWIHPVHSLSPPMPICLIKKIVVLVDLASSFAQTGTGMKLKQSRFKHVAL